MLRRGSPYSAGNNTVQMEMPLYLLRPGMQYGNETKFAFKPPLRIMRKSLQNPFHHSEQFPEEQLAVGIYKIVERMRQSKDAVEVLHGQQFLAAFAQPLFFGAGLTGGAVPVLTGVVHRHFTAALVTFVDMSTKGFGAAVQNAPYGFADMRRQSMRPVVRLPAGSDHVRHPIGGGHGYIFLQIMSNGLLTFAKCSGVTCI